MPRRRYLRLKEHTHTFVNEGGHLGELDFRFPIGAPVSGLNAFARTQQLGVGDKLANALRLGTSPIVAALVNFDVGMDMVRAAAAAAADWEGGEGGKRGAHPLEGGCGGRLWGAAVGAWEGEGGRRRRVGGRQWGRGGSGRRAHLDGATHTHHAVYTLHLTGARARRHHVLRVVLVLRWQPRVTSSMP